MADPTRFVNNDYPDWSEDRGAEIEAGAYHLITFRLLVFTYIAAHD